jgi:membrane protein required for beta-lactamase induction
MLIVNIQWTAKPVSIRMSEVKGTRVYVSVSKIVTLQWISNSGQLNIVKNSLLWDQYRYFVSNIYWKFFFLKLYKL